MDFHIFKISFEYTNLFFVRAYSVRNYTNIYLFGIVLCSQLPLRFSALSALFAVPLRLFRAIFLLSGVYHTA